MCGAGLLIGDQEVTEVASDAIRIKTASGAVLSFYRKPRVDYALVFRERLKRIGLDACKEEFQLRAIEHTVNVCRANTGLDLEGAKKLVLASSARRNTFTRADLREMKRDSWGWDDD